MKIYANLSKCMRIYENRCKVMKIYENRWNPLKSMGHICSEHIHASYICLQREINCLNRGNGNWCFRETWTLTCKTRVKVTILMKTWNDPTVITVILPQPVSHKTIIKRAFLTKVLKYIFYWTSTRFQYYWGGLTGWNPSTMGGVNPPQHYYWGGLTPPSFWYCFSGVPPVRSTG